MNLYNQLNAPTGGVSHLSSAIDQYGSNHIQQMVNRNMIPQYDAQQLLTIFRNNINNITAALAQQYAGYSSIDAGVIQTTTVQAINEIYARLQAQAGGGYQQTQFQQPAFQQQRFAYPQQQPGGSSFVIHGSAGGNVVNRNIGGDAISAPSLTGTDIPSNTQIQQGNTLQKTDEVVSATGKLTLVRVDGAQHTYTTVEDPEPTTFSTGSMSGSIVDVMAKATITDENGDVVNYSSVFCHTHEPSMFHVINGFARTNPSLCAGNWVSDITFRRFIMKEYRLPATTTPIDISCFAPEHSKNMSASEIISTVVNSITERDFSVVKTLDELICKEMNELMRLYMRHSGDISISMRVEELRDIVKLPAYRDRQFGEINFHQKYEAMVLKCFKMAVSRVITDITRFGFFMTSDIVTNMIACPNFVARGPKFCDREMEISDTNFINAVSAKYTAFARDGRIVVANFIPKQLRDDLMSGNYALRLGVNLNIFDHLATKIWQCEPKTIFMKEGNDVLTVSLGITIDGIPFYMCNDLDIYEGIEMNLPF